MISNSRKYKYFPGYIEALVMQHIHQKIKFEPRNIFSFNKKLIVDCVAYAVTYNAVFLQFYYY